MGPGGGDSSGSTFLDCVAGDSAAWFRVLGMQAVANNPRRGDDHLWMTALGLSLFGHVAIVVVIGLLVLQAALTSEHQPPPVAAEEETTAVVFLEAVESTAGAQEPAKPRFARTSPDQAGSPVEDTPFIGERDTRAASERVPDASAPPLPAQAGIEPRDEGEIETTESDYQDGLLEPAEMVEAAATEPQQPAAATPVENVQPVETAAAEQEARPAPMRETLLEGPNPVDVEVPRETGDSPADDPPAPVVADARTAEESESPPEPREPTETSELEKSVDAPKPAAPQDPAFQGYQRKTAIVGSISRTGRSSLDVADTPLGRYQALISRAVELEWQRNCVRHRDFITPGFLTVRFFVEPGGKVKSVEFVGDMETGEIQKGFTLNSIRDAAIPSMPPALRKEYTDEPLELMFRFYF